jgi:NAD(P)H-dependent FMN reductase
MKFLAISGSLRAASSNGAVLQAMRRLAPDAIEFAIYAGLGTLPHFNPDVEAGPLPEPAATLRHEVGQADALVISSPEYAHGVPGSLKNALDWLVGSLDFAGKPVALINTAPRATHAQASLRETLETMAARIVADASIALVLPNGSSNVDAVVADPACAAALRGAIEALARAVADV